jgi:hypothetical protein
MARDVVSKWSETQSTSTGDLSMKMQRESRLQALRCLPTSKAEQEKVPGHAGYRLTNANKR